MILTDAIQTAEDPNRHPRGLAKPKARSAANTRIVSSVAPKGHSLLATMTKWSNQ